MKVNSCLTALVLVFTLLSAVPSVWTLELPATPAEHAAGCHDSMPERPTPKPANHQCCSVGHDWAITVLASVLHAIEHVETRTQAHGFHSDLFSNRSLAFISDSPPPLAPSLRI
jgi:hypothetical protein